MSIVANFHTIIEKDLKNMTDTITDQVIHTIDQAKRIMTETATRIATFIVALQITADITERTRTVVPDLTDNYNRPRQGLSIYKDNPLQLRYIYEDNPRQRQGFFEDNRQRMYDRPDPCREQRYDYGRNTMPIPPILLFLSLKTHTFTNFTKNPPSLCSHMLSA